MKTILIIVLSILISTFSIAQVEITSLLPDPFTLPGMQAKGEPEIYEGDYLFDMINGGADVYFEFGFDKVVAQSYYGMQGNSVLKVEIYQMSDTDAAFGIFLMNASQAPIQENKGVFSASGAGYKMMQKGSYFIIISYNNLKEELEQNTVERVSQDIGSKIQEYAGYPAIITSTLKPCPVSKKSIYFKGSIALRNATYLNFKIPFDYVDGIYYKCDVFDFIAFNPADNADIIQQMDLLVTSILSKNETFTPVRESFGFSIKENDHLKFDVRQEDGKIILIKYI